MSNEEYIGKWLDDSLSDEERKLFEASETYLSLKKMTNALKSFKAQEFQVEKELEKLNARKRRKGKTVVMQWLNPLVKIAAVFLIMITAYFFFYLNVDTTVQTVAAEKSEFFLPDSSKVALNALSKVSYKKKIWNFKRQVQLEGEAYFSVAKGSKFDVETNSGIISVLGTHFNVKNRDDYFEVVCYEGLVQVENNTENIKLSSGHGFRILNGNAEQYKNESKTGPSWTSGQSTFRSVPFAQVIEEFERQYNVTISSEHLNLEQLFTGTFLYNDIDLAIQAISAPLNLKYEIKSDHIIELSARID